MSFFSRPFWIFFFKKKNVFGFFQWKWLSYEVSFFLHFLWFLHNLGKDFIRTNIHTTTNWNFFFFLQILNYLLLRPTSYIFLKKQHYCLAFYVRYFCVQFIAHLPICDVFFHIQNEANVIMAQNNEMEKVNWNFFF